jgi:hypothetical protein
VKPKLLAGFGLLALCSPSAAHPDRLRQASFVFDHENPRLLTAIRKGTDHGITFNGRFSLAYVSCGIACGSYWIVDRRSGGVALVPELWAENEMTWDVEAQRNSDVLKVIYGPRDPVNPNCHAQRFRWVSRKFVAVNDRTSVACPP